MAEYYPLLSRAVASLRDAPLEKRRAIYDRARQALLDQLRSMQPAVPEEAITRESTALDEAIERIEAEMDRTRAAPPASEAPSAPPPPPKPVKPPPPPAERPASAPPVVAAPIPVVDPPTPPPAPDSATLRARPPSATRPLAAPPRAAGPRPAAEALQRIIADQGVAPPVIRATRLDEEEAERTGASARVSAALPSAPVLKVSTPDGAPSEPVDAEPARPARPQAERSAVPRDETAPRPAAPRPVTRERFNPRVLILAAIGAAVVLGIAYTAYRLRDRPEALARLRAAQVAAEQAEAQKTGKVSNRASSEGAAAPTAAPAAAPAPSSPPPAIAAPASGDTPATPAPAAVAEGTAQPAPAEQPAANATAATAPEAGGIAVAQRAAFLIDAPDDPQKIKTFVGTVLWRTDNVNPGQGQPLAQAVHADIDIPDGGLKMTMVLQRNTEAQFPASHTLDLRFTPEAGSAVGSVKQINVPQMRKDDSPTGDTLVGLPVTITENYFLVGLSRGEAMAKNLELIKSRNWFDIPVMMASGKVAKITFEKGATGQQVVDQVFAGWQ